MLQSIAIMILTLRPQPEENVGAVHFLAAEYGAGAGSSMTGVNRARRRHGVYAESLAECCERTRRVQRSRWREVGCRRRGGGGYGCRRKVRIGRGGR